MTRNLPSVKAPIIATDKVREEAADEILVRLSFLNPGWGIGRLTEEFNMMTGLDITVAAIRARLATYRERYEELAPERMEQLRLREVQRLDQLEQEAWKAWQAMLSGGEETFETWKKNKEGEFELREIRKKKTTNKIEISFLNTISKIQEQRQKLLGLSSAAGQASAIDAINKNDAMKVYVGVSPEDWDSSKGEVIDGELSDGRKENDEQDVVRAKGEEGQSA